MNFKLLVVALIGVGAIVAMDHSPRKKRKRTVTFAPSVIAHQAARSIVDISPTACCWSGCAATFDNLAQFGAHALVHECEYAPFYCSWPECNQRFDTLHDLHKHTFIKHVVPLSWRFDADLVTIPCPFEACSEALDVTQIDAVVAHLSRHTGHCNYQCLFCGALGVDAASLLRHVISGHLGAPWIRYIAFSTALPPALRAIFHDLMA